MGAWPGNVVGLRANEVTKTSGKRNIQANRDIISFEPQLNKGESHDAWSTGKRAFDSQRRTGPPHYHNTSDLNLKTRTQKWSPENVTKIRKQIKNVQKGIIRSLHSDRLKYFKNYNGHNNRG